MSVLESSGRIALRPWGASMSFDIVEANDPKQIEKAAMIIRAYGHSTTETLVATPWKEFLALIS